MAIHVSVSNSIFLFLLLSFLSGCTTLPLEERIVREGEERQKKLKESQRTYENLKSRMEFVCTPVVIPNYRNVHLNTASVKLAESCRRGCIAMLKYMADREKEDNIRNVVTKVFLEPDNYIEIRPTHVGEFPCADGTVKKMSPEEFARHLLNIRNKIAAAAAVVIRQEQQKSDYEALLLQFSVLELWQMELAKSYMRYAAVLSDKERETYRNELQQYQLWDLIVAGDQSVRKLTQTNKSKYFIVFLREMDTAASVARAVLIEIDRFRRICESRHKHRQGADKVLAIAAEVTRVAPYVAKATQQSVYVSWLLSYATDEWALNWYNVDDDLMTK